MRVSDDINTFWILKNFSIFQQLSKTDLLKLYECTQMKKFDKKHLIYLPNDKADKIYFLKQGKVKINSFSNDGKELIHAFITAGEIFGEMAIAGDIWRKNYAEAIEQSIVCYMPTTDFSILLKELPVLQNEITKLIGLRLVKAQKN
ncbi:cyclic nucleotide-binding domain-containing protein [Labilibacter sediminis]|nr:cyclic nucleotide-binding domain-containing protein [Labilibacter sediminis]